MSIVVELARRERDLVMIDEAIEMRRNGNGLKRGFSLIGFMIDDENLSMDTDQLNHVLERKRNHRWKTIMLSEYYGIP